MKRAPRALSFHGWIPCIFFRSAALPHPPLRSSPSRARLKMERHILVLPSPNRPKYLPFLLQIVHLKGRVVLSSPPSQSSVARCEPARVHGREKPPSGRANWQRGRLARGTWISGGLLENEREDERRKERTCEEDKASAKERERSEVKNR